MSNAFFVAGLEDFVQKLESKDPEHEQVLMFVLFDSAKDSHGRFVHELDAKIWFRFLDEGSGSAADIFVPELRTKSKRKDLERRNPSVEISHKFGIPQSDLPGILVFFKYNRSSLNDGAYLKLDPSILDSEDGLKDLRKIFRWLFQMAWDIKWPEAPSELDESSQLKIFREEMKKLEAKQNLKHLIISITPMIRKTGEFIVGVVKEIVISYFKPPHIPGASSSE